MIVIKILLGWLLCSLSFAFGLFFASSSISAHREEKFLCNKHLYNVKVRYGQKDKYVKTITIFASNEQSAIATALKHRIKYNGIAYPVNSIISVTKSDNLEGTYYVE